MAYQFNVYTQFSSGSTNLSQHYFNLNGIDESNEDFKIVYFLDTSVDLARYSAKEMMEKLSNITGYGKNYTYDEITESLVKELSTAWHTGLITASGQRKGASDKTHRAIAFVFIFKNKIKSFTLSGSFDTKTNIYGQSESERNILQESTTEISPDKRKCVDCWLDVPIQDKENGTIFSYQMGNSSLSYTFELNATMSESAPTVTIPIGKYLEKCALDADEIEVDGIRKTLTLTAEDGYVFERTIPFILLNGDMQHFTVAEDMKTATIKITPTAGQSVDCYACAELYDVPDRKSDYSTYQFHTEKFQSLFSMYTNHRKALMESIFHIFTSYEQNYAMFEDVFKCNSLEEVRSKLEAFEHSLVVTEKEIVDKVGDGLYYELPDDVIGSLEWTLSDGTNKRITYFNIVLVVPKRNIDGIKINDISTSNSYFYDTYLNGTYSYSIDFVKVGNSEVFDFYVVQVSTDKHGIFECLNGHHNPNLGRWFEIPMYDCADWNNNTVVPIEYYIKNCRPSVSGISIDNGVIEIKPYTGFDFEGLVSARVDGKGVVIPVSDGVARLELDAMAVNEIIVYAEAKHQSDEAERVMFATSLENCTINRTSLLVGFDNNIMLFANDGYEFAETPYLSITGYSLAFSVLADKKSAIAVYKPSSASEKITVTAKASKIEVLPEYITIEKHIENCDLNADTVKVGSETILMLTARDGYAFEETPTITIDGETSEFSLLNANRIATFSFTPTSGSEISVNAVAVKSGASEEKVAVVNKYLSNVSLSPDISEFVEGSYITLTLTIEDGYEWVGVPTLGTNAFDGSYIERRFEKQDEKTYIYHLPTTPFIDGVESPIINITASALPITAIEDKYGLVTLYKPTAEDLKALAKVRFLNMTQNTFLDIGQFITSLKSIPLDVPTRRSGNIILGKNDTDINAPIVDDDEITLDLGSVHLGGLYGNALDVSGMSIEVVLPYIGIVDIDASKCANKSIGIKYRVNLISGSCVALIYLKSEIGDVLLKTAQGTIGFDVPYILKGESVQVMQNVEGEILFNDSPCVNVYQKQKSVGDNNIYRTKYISLVGDLKGYNKISKLLSVNNENVVMSDEMEEIEKLLISGIIV